MAQMIFQWPVEASYASEDFILSASNEAAVQFLDHWPESGGYNALLTGPASSGKTHLAQRWAKRVGARVIDSGLLGRVDSAELWQDAASAVLENIESVSDETALFHLLRFSETQQKPLLLTAQSDAKHLPFLLPDICSRLLALPRASIAAPDENALHGFLLKYFSDHQLRVSDDVIQYMIRRMERSFDNARSMAEIIERASNEAKRDITIPFVRSLTE